jgi:hypothetical protein
MSGERLAVSGKLRTPSAIFCGAAALNAKRLPLTASLNRRGAEIYGQL